MLRVYSGLSGEWSLVFNVTLQLTESGSAPIAFIAPVSGTVDVRHHRVPDRPAGGRLPPGLRRLRIPRIRLRRGGAADGLPETSPGCGPQGESAPWRTCSTAGPVRRSTAWVSGTRAGRLMAGDRGTRTHVDCTGQLNLVHNGIIVNADDLRTELIAAGHRFATRGRQ